MALIATIGASNANSYVTAYEADTYFENRVHASAWDDFAYQEEVLMTASQMLDWYVKFKGIRSSSTQALHWPRTNVIRGDGSEVDETIIPNDVKVATYELALSSILEDRTDDSNSLSGIKEIKAGSLMIKADSNDDMEAIPEKVWKILSDLRTSGTGMVRRLMRA